MSTPLAALVDDWLRELSLPVSERVEREGVTSWDLVLDGMRRFDVPVTLILDPLLALIAWVHYAPALNDSFRKSYRQFLRWNDELPFVKFSLSVDERPVLASELPVQGLDRDTLGVAICRLLATCDLLLEESAHWIWSGGARRPAPDRPSRQEELFSRFAADLVELAP